MRCNAALVGEAIAKGCNVTLVLCGSFNPIHASHLDAIQGAEDGLKTAGYVVAQKWLCLLDDDHVRNKTIARNEPLSNVVPFRKRLEMCLAVAAKNRLLVAETAFVDSKSAVEWLQQQCPIFQIVRVCGEKRGSHGTLWLSGTRNEESSTNIRRLAALGLLWRKGRVNHAVRKIIRSDRLYQVAERTRTRSTFCPCCLVPEEEDSDLESFVASSFGFDNKRLSVNKVARQLVIDRYFCCLVSREVFPFFVVKEVVLIRKLVLQRRRAESAESDKYSRFLFLGLILYERSRPKRFLLKGFVDRMNTNAGEEAFVALVKRFRQMVRSNSESRSREVDASDDADEEMDEIRTIQEYHSYLYNSSDGT